MIRNIQLKMEEKHIESLYCLMNINTEPPPPPEIQDPVYCVNFFYEYKVMLIGNSCI